MSDRIFIGKMFVVLVLCVASVVFVAAERARQLEDRSRAKGLSSKLDSVEKLLNLHGYYLHEVE